MKKEFKQCPNCGSENRFLENLAKELKKKGWARLDWRYAFDYRQGSVIDPDMEKHIPTGGEVPAYTIATDICEDCGTIYATFMETTVAKKSTNKPNIVLPNIQLPHDFPEQTRPGRN